MTDNWISVNDRMPPEKDSIYHHLKGTTDWIDGMFDKISNDYRVVFKFEDGRRIVSHDLTVDGKWCSENYKFSNDPKYRGKVTHWMENPSLPEESE